MQCLIFKTPYKTELVFCHESYSLYMFQFKQIYFILMVKETIFVFVDLLQSVPETNQY